MKNNKLKAFFVSLLALCIFSIDTAAQVTAPAAAPLLKRTNSKSETLDFGSGGTVTITGAPTGSIRVEGWQQNKIEISAEIEVQAETEADLALLSSISNYVVDTSMGHTTIQSVPPNKQALKGKKYNKALLLMPFKIDYVVKVPKYADLEINGGDGDLAISGIDGAMLIKFLKTNAKINLVGGAIAGTFGSGNVDVVIPDRGWRGRSADIQLASGTMNVQLPMSLNAEVDGKILRTGKIESTYTALKPRERDIPLSEKIFIAKAGSGGIPLKFTVGDGTLNFLETKK
jgi:hypothetical protein